MPVKQLPEACCCNVVNHLPGVYSGNRQVRPARLLGQTRSSSYLTSLATGSDTLSKTKRLLYNSSDHDSRLRATRRTNHDT